MAYDEKLAERIRTALGKRKGVQEKQMFGGIAFLLNGNMCVGVHQDAMIVRLAVEDTDKALAQRHTKVFDLTGRPMKGWILVQSKGLASATQLGKWIKIATAYAGSLPKK
jgi:TfoX/Sxy family transcriptional regulator of competence genes